MSLGPADGGTEGCSSLSISTFLVRRPGVTHFNIFMSSDGHPVPRFGPIAAAGSLALAAGAWWVNPPGARALLRRVVPRRPPARRPWRPSRRHGINAFAAPIRHCTMEEVVVELQPRDLPVVLHTSSMPSRMKRQKEKPTVGR